MSGQKRCVGAKDVSGQKKPQGKKSLGAKKASGQKKPRGKKGLGAKKVGAKKVGAKSLFAVIWYVSKRRTACDY